MQKRARGYIGATAFGGRLPPRAPKCVSGETGALARPPPFPSCHLERSRDFTEVKSLRSRKACPERSRRDPYTSLRTRGETGCLLDLGERDCLMAKVRAAINRGPPSELQDSWKACRLGVPPPPPLFRYIRIIGLAGSFRKVFKNNDLHGKYSGIRT